MHGIRSSLQAEWKKVKQLPGIRKKAAYIRDYYSLWILGAVLFLCLLLFMIHRFTTARKENWLYITFANTYAEIGDGSTFWKGYVDYTGYDPSEKNIFFNNHSYFDYNKGVTGNSYFEAFVAYTDAGTLDAVTMEADSLTALGESGRLLDLDSPACASIKAKYGDRFLYCEPYDKEYSTEPVPVGIDLGDSRLMTEFHLYADSCALGIGAQSQHIEAVEQFLDYVYRD